MIGASPFASLQRTAGRSFQKNIRISLDLISYLCSMKQKIYEVDSIDGYNKWYGRETLHPLVTVIDIKESPEWLNGATLRYGLYGIFLKQGAGCSARYGREKYDYGLRLLYNN